MLIGLRYAGIIANTYDSLSAAKDAGAQVGIYGAVRRADCEVSDSSQDRPVTKNTYSSTVEVYVILVDLSNYTIVWEGTLDQKVEHNQPPPAYSGTEEHNQPVRAMIISGLVQVSMKLSAQISAIRPKLLL